MMEFKPLYLIIVWKEPGSLTRRAPVAFVSLGGIGRGGFNARVTLDGTALKINMKWPNPVICSNSMPEKWLSDHSVRYERCHPE